MTRDLAAVLARDIIDDIADEIRDDPSFRRRVTSRLRDELHTLKDRLLCEIRLTEADYTPDCPAPQTTSTTNTGDRNEDQRLLSVEIFEGKGPG